MQYDKKYFINSLETAIEAMRDFEGKFQNLLPEGVECKGLYKAKILLRPKYNTPYKTILKVTEKDVKMTVRPWRSLKRLDRDEEIMELIEYHLDKFGAEVKGNFIEI